MLLILTACAVGGGELSLAFDEPIHTVSVNVANGELHVLDGADAVRVDWEGGGVSAGDALVDHEVVDGTLYFDADCGLTCGAEMFIEVPEGTALELCMDNGELHVQRDQPGDTQVLLDFGELHLQVPQGEYAVDLRLGAGELYMDGIVDNPEADTLLRAELAAGELHIQGD